MPYLTPKEEVKFTTWLDTSNNPATELLAEFRMLNKIESLADLDRLANKVQDFYNAIRNIIRKNSNSILKLNDHQGVCIEEDTVTVEAILAFSAFCLVTSKISQTDFQNFSHYFKYFEMKGAPNKKYHNKTNLKSTLIYLNETNCLIEDTEKSISPNDINYKILFLQEFFTPLDTAIEYLKDRVPVSISNELIIQLDKLVTLLKKEAFDTVNKTLDQDQSCQKITHKFAQLVSGLSVLIVGQEMFASNISICSAGDRNASITKFEESLSSMSPNLSLEMQNLLQGFVEQTKIAVECALQEFSIENFSEQLTKPLGQLVESKQYPDQVEHQLKLIRQVFKNEIERLFKLGKRTEKIGDNLRDAVFQLNSYASEFLNETNALTKKEKEQILLQKLNLANRIFIARKILDPLDLAMNESKLTISSDLNRELINVYRQLESEIQSCLENGEPEEKINQRFGQFVSELGVLTKILGNPQVDRNEKLATIQKLIRHTEEQYSIFPKEIVNALRKLIGVALTSAFLDRAESMIGFFKPGFFTNTNQQFKSMVKNVTRP